MLCSKRLARRTAPQAVIEDVAMGTTLGLLHELLCWFALNPPTFLIAKDKVVSGVQWSLDTVAPITVFQLDGGRLVPELQNGIIMLSLKQKGEFDFGTFRLNDALHLFGGIPDGHIASTGSWRSARRGITNMSQQLLSFSRHA